MIIGNSFKLSKLGLGFKWLTLKIRDKVGGNGNKNSSTQLLCLSYSWLVHHKILHGSLALLTHYSSFTWSFIFSRGNKVWVIAKVALSNSGLDIALPLLKPKRGMLVHPKCWSYQEHCNLWPSLFNLELPWLAHPCSSIVPLCTSPLLT